MKYLFRFTVLVVTSVAILAAVYYGSTLLSRMPVNAKPDFDRDGGTIFVYEVLEDKDGDLGLLLDCLDEKFETAGMSHVTVGLCESKSIEIRISRKDNSIYEHTRELARVREIVSSIRVGKTPTKIINVPQ